MKQDDFAALLQRRLDKIQETLVSKRAEYAAPEDVLHNFKKGAAILRCTPAECCVSYLTKHLVSIFDIMDEIGKGVHRDNRAEQVDEKIGDALVYLILLEAIIMEKQK